MNNNSRIWKICPYLHNLNDCKKCPAWEKDKHYGKVKNMCRGLAEEVLNIAQTGNEFRKQ